MFEFFFFFSFGQCLASLIEDNNWGWVLRDYLIRRLSPTVPEALAPTRYQDWSIVYDPVKLKHMKSAKNDDHSQFLYFLLCQGPLIYYLDRLEHLSCHN